MGILTNFFETERIETKGRINRLLVVANTTPACEAMVRMLDVYYTRDEAQDKYTESHCPQITVVDTAPSSESQFQEWRPKMGMEYTTNIQDQKSLTGRIGLEFRNGRILKSTVKGDGAATKDVVANFTPDSRDEAASILWSKIISSYARRGEYDVVLYPDTATRIASKVLGLTSQGRGFILPFECGTLVKMPNGIPIQNFNGIFANMRGVHRSSNEGPFRY
jgi:hypothetical protein